MWPLLLFSIISFSCIIERLIFWNKTNNYEKNPFTQNADWDLFSEGIKFLHKKKDYFSNTYLVCGGGRKNNFLIKTIK